MNLNRLLNRSIMASLLAALAGGASAAGYSWVNPLGGDFAQPANWLPNGNPGALDTAMFNLNSAYVVSNVSGSNHKLVVQRDNVTLNISSSFALSAGAESLIVGDTANTGQLTLVGALDCTDAVIGKSASATGIVTVNPASLLNATTLAIGNYGMGSLHLTPTSSLTGVDVIVGKHSGTSSNPNLLSLDSAEMAATTLVVGLNGSGRLEMDNASSADISDTLSMGAVSTGSGAVSLANGSTLAVNRLVTGVFSNYIDLQDGSTLSANTAILDGAWIDGELDSLTAGGSTLDVAGLMKIGVAGGYYGILDIDSVVKAGSLHIGGEASSAATGTGVLTLVQSSGTIGNDLRVGVSGTGSLNMDMASTLSSQTAVIGDLADSVGTLEITAGSSWTNASTLIVGNELTSSGYVTVYDNSKLETGAVATPVAAHIGKDGYGNVALSDEGTHWSHHGDLIVGLNFGSQGDLIVNNNASFVADNLYVAGDGVSELGGLGSIYVGDADLPGGNVVINHDAQVGRGGWGFVFINDGGSCEIKGNLSAGIGSYSSIGSIEVRGDGALLTVKGTTQLGLGGSGGVIVEGGGVFNSGPADIGGGTDCYGYINVNDQGTWNAAGDVSIGSAAPLPVNDGTLSIDNGKVVISGALNINAAGLLTVKNADLSVPSIALNGGAIQGSGTLSNPIVATGGNLSADDESNPLNLAGSFTSSGNLVKSGPGTVILSGPQTHHVKALFTIEDGAAKLMTNAGENLSIAVNFSASVEFDAAQRLDRLTLKSGYVDPDLGDIPGARAIALPSGNHTIILNGLSIDTTSPLPASFDLKNNDLVLEYDSASPYAQILQWIKTDALTTSQPDPALTHPGVLAPIDNASLHLASWNGMALSGYEQIIVAYAYLGDVNLDGRVNGEDYVNVLANMNHAGTWIDGDLNYDGMVNLADYNLVTAHLGAGDGTLGGGPLLISGLFSPPAGGLNMVAVPEPSTLGLLGLLGGLLIRRRHK